MATKRLTRGKPIRVPGPGSVTIQKDGAVVFKPASRRRKNPAAKPTRNRKPAPTKRKPATMKRKPATKKRTARRATARRTRR